MELKDFIEKFAEQFDDTAASEFTADAKFKEFDEWSSLVALCVSDAIRESVTIEDLFNHVNKQV